MSESNDNHDKSSSLAALSKDEAATLQRSKDLIALTEKILGKRISKLNMSKLVRQDDQWVAEIIAWAEECCIGEEIVPRDKAQLMELEKLGLGGYDPENNIIRYEIKYLPPSFGKLQNLRELYLSKNHLTAVPESIGQLQNLTKLYLSKNHLTAVPESIGQLQNLKELNLHWNQLTAVPESIVQLQNLRILYLSGNHLTAVPESIGQLQNLIRLNLCRNQLTALPESLMQLQQLKYLDLRGNPIDEAALSPRLRDFIRSIKTVW